jgi:ribosomal protein L11 methyltransferase
LELFPRGVEDLGDRYAVYTDDEGEQTIREHFGDVDSHSIAEGWEEAWREFHHGIVLGRFWVGPPWEREQAPADAEVIAIDPGRAFGTGAHATTRLCLELVQELPPTSLLDVGCGSGVLSIAAAKLGFGPVVGVDNEADAVETTLVNAQANGVQVAAYRVDALTGRLPAAGVVVANIALEPVERLLPRLETRLAVTSGYLERDEPVVEGWRRIDRRDREGWAADLFERA